METTRLVGGKAAVIASGGLAHGSERQFDRRSQVATVRCSALHTTHVELVSQLNENPKAIRNIPTHEMSNQAKDCAK